MTKSSVYNARTANMGFYASWALRSNFGCLHRCTLVRKRWNSVGLLVVILYFYFFIGQRFSADDFQIPQHRKAFFVVGNGIRILSNSTIKNKPTWINRYFKINNTLLYEP